MSRKPQTCVHCGRQFVPGSHTQTYCARECVREAQLARQSEAGEPNVKRRETDDAVLDFAAYIIRACLELHAASKRPTVSAQARADCKQRIEDVDVMLVDLRRALAGGRNSPVSRHSLISAMSDLRDCAFQWNDEIRNLPRPMRRLNTEKINDGLV